MSKELIATLTATAAEIRARNQRGHLRRLQLRDELETLEHDLAFNAGRLAQIEVDLRAAQPAAVQEPLTPPNP